MDASSPVVSRYSYQSDTALVAARRKPDAQTAAERVWRAEAGRREAEAARREAEVALEATTSFFASLGHEFRTPMNAVFGMAQLLMESELRESQQDMVKTIQGGAQSMVRLVDDLLDLSRIRAGRLELEYRPFNLRDLIEGCLDLVATSAADKHLGLAYELDGCVPAWLMGDETRLRQVLINLLGNAIKFTEEGEVIVRISSVQVDGSSHRVSFSVEDTGIGIPSEVIDSIFQMFTQADASTRRLFGGTGLGLWISRQLSELMGGRLWVESEVGKGSAFKFTISADSHIALDECPRGEDPVLLGRKLLVVDSNAKVGRLVSQQAQSWGMNARSVVTSNEVLELLHSGESFDVVIVDRDMPGMDGLLLANEIRQVLGETAPPLVMMTTMFSAKGGTSPRPTDRAGRNFKAYLPKPVKARRLHAVLLKALAEPTVSETQPGPDSSQTPISPSTPGESKRTVDPGLASRLQLRVAVADDDAPSRLLAMTALECMGFEASEVSDGSQLLELMDQQDFDVVLMDVHMPVMDGLTATAQIRADRPTDRRPYVIALSGGAAEDDIGRCLAAGMDDFVSKPYALTALQEALERGAVALAECEVTTTR